MQNVLFQCVLGVCTCSRGWLCETAAEPRVLTMTGLWKRLLESAAAALATLNASVRESHDFLLKIEFTSWITWSWEKQHKATFISDSGD